MTELLAAPPIAERQNRRSREVQGNLTFVSETSLVHVILWFLFLQLLNIQRSIACLEMA